MKAYVEILGKYAIEIDFGESLIDMIQKQLSKEPRLVKTDISIEKRITEINQHTTAYREETV